MIGRGFAILFVIIGFGLPANLLSYNDDSTHYELTQEVANFYSAVSGRVLSSEEKEAIASGAAAEDTPPRWVNHFYDPVHNEPWLARYAGKVSQETVFASAKGAFGIDRTYTTKDWSQNESAQNKYQAYKGNRTFQRALYEYTQGNKKEALYTLGFIMHLIEDMTVPDHTRGDTHWDNGITKDPGSPYEKWAEKLTRSTNLTIAQNLVRQKAKPVQVDSLNQVFDSIASYSNNNFFSEDTINDSRFKLPEFINDGTFLYKKEQYRLAIYTTDRETRLIKPSVDDDSILQGYWSQLSPLAVRAGAGIMDYFFREVERIEKEKVVLENPNSLSKRLAGGFMLSPYGEVNRAERAAGTVKQVAVSLGDAAQQVSGSVGAAAKSAFTDVWQKVKLAALVAPFQTTPSASSPSAPHPRIEYGAGSTLSPEGRGDNGQVLGEAVEASNVIPAAFSPRESGEGIQILKPSNSAGRQVQNDAAASTPEQAVKKEVKKEPEKKVVSGNDNKKTSSSEIPRDLSPRQGGVRDDKGVAAPISASPPRVGSPVSVAAPPTSPNPSLVRRGVTGPSFIGIHAPSNPHPRIKYGAGSTLSLEGRGDNNAPSSPQGGDDTPAATILDNQTATSTPDTADSIPTSTPDTISSSTPDAIPPTTWITILSATTTAPSFLVQWSGADNIQATPASYDVQYQTLTPVSSTGQALTLSLEGRGDSLFNPVFSSNDWLDWLLATSTASSYFTGLDEKTYGFRSRGRDEEGNQSIYPPAAETYTYLNLSVPSAPTVTSHQNNQTITYNDDIAITTQGVQITLAGSADPSDTVSITYSSSTTASSTATTTASSLGLWSKQLTLSEGANTITLQSQEADSDVSSSTAIILNLNTAPSTITDLSIITASTTTASTALVWTTPNQANLNISGSSAYYDVRYISGPSCAITETGFGSLAQASNPPVPSSTAGDNESFIITNLTENTNYCFGLKTFNGSRLSNLSNITAITLPSLHGVDITQTATSTNRDWGWNNIDEWWRIAQSFQPTHSSINGFEFTMCRRFPNGYNTPGLRLVLCKGLPDNRYGFSCDSGNFANNILYLQDYSSAETEAMMPFCGGWAGVPLRIPPQVITFSFSAITLTPGQTYSLILSAIGSGGMQAFTSSYQAAGNPYVNGALFRKTDINTFNALPDADWYFKTLY